VHFIRIFFLEIIKIFTIYVPKTTADKMQEIVYVSATCCGMLDWPTSGTKRREN